MKTFDFENNEVVVLLAVCLVLHLSNIGLAVLEPSQSAVELLKTLKFMKEVAFTALIFALLKCGKR